VNYALATVITPLPRGVRAAQAQGMIVVYRPGSLSEVLTEHYRRAHPEALGVLSQ
jgi:hypothetical protein